MVGAAGPGDDQGDEHDLKAINTGPRLERGLAVLSRPAPFTYLSKKFSCWFACTVTESY